MLSSPARAARSAGTVAAAVILSIVAMFNAPSAGAAVPEIETSSDGTTWAARPIAEIFPADYVFVPGDTLRRTVYLRNARTEPMSIVVVASNAESIDPLLAGALTVTLEPQGSSGVRDRPLAEIADCTVVVPRRDLQPGEVIGITVAVAISPALVEQQAQTAAAAFRLHAGAGDRQAPIAAEGCPSIPGTGSGTDGGSDEGTIAFTGFTGVEFVFAGLGALFAGGLLLLASLVKRRRGKEPS